MAGAHSVFGVIATRSVGQQCEAIRRQKIQQVRLTLVLTEIGPAQGDSDDFRPGGIGCVAGLLEVGEFPGTSQ
jgi:hypothetical protein